MLNARASAAQEVARIKLASDPNAVFYRPEREAQVLRAVKERNQGPLDGESVARLFREIMSECLALEMPLKVAYLGPEGTFTQAAALKHFGHSVRTEPMSSISDVFQEVETEAADYGVVPVENSTEGVVSHTLDMFQHSQLHIPQRFSGCQVGCQGQRKRGLQLPNKGAVRDRPARGRGSRARCPSVLPLRPLAAGVPTVRQPLALCVPSCHVCIGRFVSWRG